MNDQQIDDEDNELNQYKSKELTEWAADYDEYLEALKDEESDDKAGKETGSKLPGRHRWVKLILVVGFVSFFSGVCFIVFIFGSINLFQTNSALEPPNITLLLTPTAVTALTTTMPDSAIENNGNLITEDTIWNKDTYLTGDVTVNTGATLTIEPGITVYFTANQDDQKAGRWEDKTELHIFGTLIAQGTEDAPIIFTSAARNPNVGDWGGILIRKNSLDSSLTNCIINYAEAGVQFYMNYEGEGFVSGQVDNCTISSNKTGILLLGVPRYDTGGGTVVVNPTLQNNVISDNSENGIFIRTTTGYGRSENKAIVQNNVIANNGTGIKILSNSWSLGHTQTTPQIRENLIQDNKDYGIYLEARGSGDASGSDTKIQPLISHNALENNSENIYLYLDPRGDDGDKLLQPEIRCNTIYNGKHGIVVVDTGSSGTLQPILTLNIFSGFNGISEYAINNLSDRIIEAHGNNWGNENFLIPDNLNGRVSVDTVFAAEEIAELCS